jgi:hypothetical protein
MANARRWHWAQLLLPLLLILYHPSESRGQAPAPTAPAAPETAAANQAAPAAGAPGTPFVRLTFLSYEQWSFVDHPYRQITGDSDFDNGRAAVSGSYLIGTPTTDAKANALTKLIHSLPPFGLEWGQTTGTFLPKAYTIGFDYYHFYQQDSQAAQSGTVPPIATDTYLYNLSLRAFAFDPTQPGINYFVGVGLGILEGTMRAKPFSGQSAEFISFSQNPFGTTRLGLESKGSNFGFRYELLLVNADRVKLAKNPYPDGQNTKTIDFSGSIFRLSLFYQFN